MAFCDKNPSKSVFYSSQNMSIFGIKRSVFSSHIQRKKNTKIMKNSQVETEKLGKTADFVISLIFPS